MTAENALCTKSHEYVFQENNICTIGITDYAVEQLGDIVFVELPEVGDSLEKGDTLGTIESVKAASEIYSPVSGEVVEVNEVLTDAPETINEDTFNAGWLVKVQATNAEADLADAMNYEAYKKEVE